MTRNIISGWAGRIKNFLYREDEEYIVIRAGTDGNWNLRRYCLQDDCWLAGEAIGRQKDVLHGGDDVSLADLTEWTVMEMARRGWQDVPLLFVAPEDELIGYMLKLPPHLNLAQQHEAAFWELDDKLTAKGLRADDFACVCMPLAEDAREISCAIWGVRYAYLQELKAAFAAANVQLVDVIAGGIVGDKMVSREQAVTAYLTDPEHRQGFCRHPSASLALARLAACWLLSLLLPLGIWAAVDVYNYEQSKAVAHMQAQELALLQPEKNEMAAALARCQSIEARERQIGSLQEKGVPWYSLLVHLGTNTCDGVFLTGITVRDNGSSCHLSGQAVTYDALAEFVGKLEADKDFFPQGVKLEKTARTKAGVANPGAIEFSLVIDKEQASNGNKDNSGAKGL